jgi:hypothetical protein
MLARLVAAAAEALGTGERARARGLLFFELAVEREHS